MHWLCAPVVLLLCLLSMQWLHPWVETHGFSGRFAARSSVEVDLLLGLADCLTIGLSVWQTALTVWPLEPLPNGSVLVMVCELESSWLVVIRPWYLGPNLQLLVPIAAPVHCPNPHLVLCHPRGLTATWDDILAGVGWRLHSGRTERSTLLMFMEPGSPWQGMKGRSPAFSEFYDLDEVVLIPFLRVECVCCPVSSLDSFINNTFWKLDLFPYSVKRWGIPTQIGPWERANLSHCKI